MNNNILLRDWNYHLILCRKTNPIPRGKWTEQLICNIQYNHKYLNVIPLKIITSILLLVTKSVNT